MEINTKDLSAIVEKVRDMEIAGLVVKKHVLKHNPDIAVAHEAAVALADVAEELVELFEDALMDKVDVDIDKLFVNDPASDYVKAVLDILAGDLSAEDRRMDALKRLVDMEEAQREVEETVEPTENFSEEEFLDELDELDDYYYGEVADNLEAIDSYLAGVDPFTFNQNQFEMARYLLRFVGDAKPSEVDSLTDYGVAIAWKRRILNGAAK